jgi:lipopolysaccharide/colanic/teichoic acid biosynthesis glycosyltransferase
MTELSEVLPAGVAPSGRMAAKRAIDVLAAAIGVMLLLPVFAAIAVAIRLDDGGPVFFRQTRIGRSGRPFQIDKFRSMKASPTGVGSNLTVAGAPRVTRVGAFLRRTKLDELPQLINVLMGEMSLVGPRPETPDLIVHYTPAQREVVLSVRPGMTDYASLLLRDESAILARAGDPARFYRERLIPLKVQLSAGYISEIGPRTDFRIILATLWSVVFPSARNPLIERSISDRLESLGATGIDDAV